MQQEDSTSIKDEHSESQQSVTSKHGVSKDNGLDAEPRSGEKENEASCDNGTSDPPYTNGDQSPTTAENNQARLSPQAAEGADLNLQSGTSILNQQLNFELESDMGNNFTLNNYWGPPQNDDSNMLPGFQSYNAPGMPSYSLNNNNSFPQPLPFGSIGQPSFMPGNSQFSSPPGMPSMSMMSNIGPMNGPMGGFNFQASQNQNQRRAITAQHNYGSMNNKPLNPRFPWNNQPTPWPSNTPPTSVSPWTMALQQHRVMARNNVGAGPGAKKNQMNQGAAINNLLAQQKMKNENQMAGQMGGGFVKNSYGGPIGSDRHDAAYSVSIVTVYDFCLAIYHQLIVMIYNARTML